MEEVSGTLGFVEREPPVPVPFGASGEEAVRLCRSWMVYLGAADTVIAPGDSRHLCDLYSRRYLAWVSDSRGNVDIRIVDEAARISAGDGRFPLIFLPGGVRPIARERADALGVALLRYRPLDGALDGANALGRQLCATGLET